MHQTEFSIDADVRFLIEMHQDVHRHSLFALIEPHYPKGEGGRPAYSLMAMLRVHLMQNWFGYSDPAMEESFYETTILRQFAGQHLDRIPDRNDPQLPLAVGKT